MVQSSCSSGFRASHDGDRVSEGRGEYAGIAPSEGQLGDLRGYEFGTQARSMKRIPDSAQQLMAEERTANGVAQGIGWPLNPVRSGLARRSGRLGLSCLVQRFHL